MVLIQELDPKTDMEGTIFSLTFALGTTLVVGLDQKDVLVWAENHYGSYYGPYTCHEADIDLVESMLIKRCLIHRTQARVSGSGADFSYLHTVAPSPEESEDDL